MKSLKFHSHLVPLVLDGSKTNTWRLFDDKDLKEDDELEFLNADGGLPFAWARIVSVTSAKLGNAIREKLEGYEKYRSEDEMIEHYERIYKRPVGRDTEVKVIKFVLIK